MQIYWLSHFLIVSFGTGLYESIIYFPYFLLIIFLWYFNIEFVIVIYLNLLKSPILENSWLKIFIIYYYFALKMMYLLLWIQILKIFFCFLCFHFNEIQNKIFSHQHKSWYIIFNEFINDLQRNFNILKINRVKNSINSALMISTFINGLFPILKIL